MQEAIVKRLELLAEIYDQALVHGAFISESTPVTADEFMALVNVARAAEALSRVNDEYCLDGGLDFGPLDEALAKLDGGV